jgi:hypothetical protein
MDASLARKSVAHPRCPARATPVPHRSLAQSARTTTQATPTRRWLPKKPQQAANGFPFVESAFDRRACIIRGATAIPQKPLPLVKPPPPPIPPPLENPPPPNPPNPPPLENPPELGLELLLVW